MQTLVIDEFSLEEGFHEIRFRGRIGIKDAVLTTVNVSGAGDYAYEIGKFLLTIQPSGQAAMQQAGKYVVVWKKTAAGSWQLHVDIWNSLPAK